jgi:hypothetical protein
MRVERFQQRLSEGGELSVDLQPHAGRKKGEPLQQSLDVGIGARELVEPEPAGDLGELARELPARAAQELELAVVVTEELLVYR